MSRGTLARLFVAVDVPLAAREELAAWAREAARALASHGDEDPARSAQPAAQPPGERPDRARTRRTRPALRPIAAESIHLTLCFLGSRPVGEIDALAAALPGCAAHACELEIGAPAWLPRRRPRALAVAVRDAAGELERLHAQLRDALGAVSGWEPERRRYRPHVTLVRVRGASGRRGRMREGFGAPAFTAAALPPTPRLAFAPESLSLYRSQLDPSGARYEALASCSLLPPDGG